MPRQVFDYDPPDRFVAGTVGPPGQRTFFLQARAGSRLTSVALEKTQVSALAERIEGLLDDLVRRAAGSVAVPALAPTAAQDNDPLDTPIEEEFRVGDMSLMWDEDTERVVVMCFAQPDPPEATESPTGADPERDEPDPDDDDPMGTGERTRLRVSLTGAAARAFAKRALAVVAAGRPPCPFCDGPLDPQGHVCPRANGYRR